MAHRGIQFGDRNLPGTDQRRKLLQIDARMQVHLDAGVERHRRGIGGRCGHAVSHQFGNRVIIGNQQAAPFPVVAQRARQQCARRCRRHAVDRGERGHHRSDPGIGGGLERRQIDVAKQPGRNIAGIIVAASLRRAIAGEMLRRRHDRIGRGQIVPLESLHLRHRHCAAQIGVLARALDDAAPARIAGDVEHRAECP